VHGTRPLRRAGAHRGRGKRERRIRGSSPLASSSGGVTGLAWQRGTVVAELWCSPSRLLEWKKGEMELGIISLECREGNGDFYSWLSEQRR
jgi:hypothetical protein